MLVERGQRPARVAHGGKRVGIVAACLCLGIAFGSLYWLYGCSLKTLHLCLFCWVLLTASLTDLWSLVIPDACVALALAIRALYVLMAPLAEGQPPLPLAMRSLAGFSMTLAFLLLVATLADRLLGIQSMGGGDIKLLAAVGCYVGCATMPLVLVVACCAGLFGALLPILRRGKVSRTFAFGPSIAFAAWLALLGGAHVEGWLSMLA